MAEKKTSNKSSSKKPTGVPSGETVKPEAAGQRVYTLSDTVSLLGASSQEEVRTELEGLSDVDLIALGRLIGTPRLAKELARNYGVFAHWLEGASPAQLSLLGFVGSSWLRVAAWAALQAEQKYEALQGGLQGSGADKLVRQAEAETIAVPARRTRDRLYNTLVHLSGGLLTWKSKIDTAYAASVTTVPVADSLSALADVAKAMLADKSPGMVARREKSTLNEAAVKRHRETAAALAKAAKAANAVKSASPVVQADVDLWDGAAIKFFEQFVAAVEDAREEDPTIPQPSIIGLRGWFRRLSRKKAGRETEEKNTGAEVEDSEDEGEG